MTSFSIDLELLGDVQNMALRIADKLAKIEDVIQVKGDLAQQARQVSTFLDELRTSLQPAIDAVHEVQEQEIGNVKEPIGFKKP